MTNGSIGEERDGETRARGREDLLERVKALRLRRTKLDESEAELLRTVVFPEIFEAHEEEVWRQLRRRGLSLHEAEDLHQAAFATLHGWMEANGFPLCIGAMLRTITKNKLRNHFTDQKGDLETAPLPSSSSGPPGTGPGVDSALDRARVAALVLGQLTEGERQVVRLVILGGLSHEAAAEVLGIPPTTLSSRVTRAKERLVEIAEQLSESQRGVA